MNEYMITITFPAVIDEGFIGLVPRQRAMVNELMAKGVISGYSLSSDRQTLWITMVANSDELAHATLEQMPLFSYMTFDVRELMFHNSPVYAKPAISLN